MSTDALSRRTILNLLRDNGIKEGHRPGIECPFLGQWHQKLHSNTTRDDIAIGEAYLHFLRGSGDMGEFWWHLWEYAGLTKDDLEGMKAGWRTQVRAFFVAPPLLFLQACDHKGLPASGSCLRHTGARSTTFAA